VLPDEPRVVLDALPEQAASQAVAQAEPVAGLVVEQAVLPVPVWSQVVVLVAWGESQAGHCFPGGFLEQAGLQAEELAALPERVLLERLPG
jgi:hypothetical protein